MTPFAEFDLPQTADARAAPPAADLNHLDWLESEAIHILREVAGQCAHPALLFSGGKDSLVLLRLAEKAFRPWASRKLKTRSLARAFSSSRRAPPRRASKRCSAIASSSVTVWRRLRDARGPVSSTTRPWSIESCTLATISRSPSSATRLSLIHI